jgi:S1-C subfamily serine protease
MRIVATLLLVLSWACATARESSVLERLSTETSAIVRKVSGAVLPITKVDGRKVPDIAGSSSVTYWYTYKSAQTPERAVPKLAVRVSDRLLLVTHEDVGKARAITVRLGKRDVPAKRVDANADLGLAVYELPAKELKKDAVFVRPDKRWEPLRRGSLGVLVGPGDDGIVGLALISRCEWHLGEFTAVGPTDTLPLFGPGGTLIGLRRGGKATRTLKVTPFLKLPKESGAAVSYNEALAYYLLQKRVPEPTVEEAHITYLAGPVLARIVEDVEKHGRIRVGYVGVVVGDARGPDRKAWLAVSAALANSPAKAAGLKPGDKITAVNGKPVASAEEFSRAIALMRPGESLELELAGGRKARLVLEDREEARVAVTPELLGLECMELTADLRAYLGVKDELTGVVVREVRPGSPAARAGILAGDVLVARDEVGITDLEGLEAGLASARDHALVSVRLWRKGQLLRKPLEIPDTQPSTRAR